MLDLSCGYSKWDYIIVFVDIDQNFGQAWLIYDGTGWQHALIGIPDIIDYFGTTVVYKTVNYTANAGPKRDAPALVLSSSKRPRTKTASAPA